MTVIEHGTFAPLVLGTHVKYCIVQAQRICPIYTKRLFSVHDLTDINSIITSLHRLHFDHFIPWVNHEDVRRDGGTYSVAKYWYTLPMALLLLQRNAPASSSMTVVISAAEDLIH